MLFRTFGTRGGAVDFQNLFIKHQAETILGVTFGRFCFKPKNEDIRRLNVPSTVIQAQNCSDLWKQGMFKKILNAILSSFPILYFKKKIFQIFYI